jgi:hypothetical protein
LSEDGTPTVTATIPPSFPTFASLLIRVRLAEWEAEAEYLVSLTPGTTSDFEVDLSHLAAPPMELRSYPARLRAALEDERGRAYVNLDRHHLVVWDETGEVEQSVAL